MSEEIIQYSPDWKSHITEFVAQAMKEGSEQTFYKNKMDLDNIQGSIWMAVVDGKVVSVSYAQESHITGTPESLRACRYHILKAHRHGRYGFKMMKKQIEWGRQQGYKHYYWTCDVKDKAKNSLYQHKRRYVFTKDDKWFDDKDYVQLKLETNLLFHDSPKSDMLQFIYSYYIDPKYTWNPIKSVIKHNHTGQDIPVEEILQCEYS
jgi:hypothetical protein